MATKIEEERSRRSVAMDVLAKMKRIEKRKKRNLVTVRLDVNTVVTTTRDRMEQLVADHGFPGIWERPKRGRRKKEI